ncbi:hypothetical protein SAMN04488029_3970 [Reichenbachiella faecimaris]|uniref:Uncharacterized protein n=1 Tax=Reichenbachiella faecimaris TaxID=692418 RepID=A0A1W2GQN7_REIFA|nr:helix-turn-helix transcriptional regulator [Reichenbachiella faecimaris]SMD38967.1 hypothetical protein SAMN04488029_3970 [Reichenbachiella faecimaris]
MKKKFTANVEKTDTGFSAYVDGLNVFSTGSTMTELAMNLVEALELNFDDSKDVINENDIDLVIDLQQFFKYYRVLNAKYLADRIGMNPTLLSQYVQGKKKVSRKQTDKILTGVQEIGKELAELNFTS